MRTTDEQAEAVRLTEMKAKYPRIKRVLTWSPTEKRLRLFRVLWVRGLGPGYGAPENYSAKLSVAIELKRWSMCVGLSCWRERRDDQTWWLMPLPCVAIRLHYERSYGGWHV